MMNRFCSFESFLVRIVTNHSVDEFDEEALVRWSRLRLGVSSLIHFRQPHMHRITWHCVFFCKVTRLLHNDIVSDNTHGTILSRMATSSDSCRGFATALPENT